MTDNYDYSPWLRQLADMAECHKKGLIKPCPKALRRAAAALEQARQEIEDLVTIKSYSDGLTKTANALGYSYAGKAMDGQRKRIEQLAAALTECSDRFENCVKLNGTDPAYATASTEPYRRLLAGDSGQ